MISDFEAALLRYVAPRLQPLGYEYLAPPRRDTDVFDFRKALINGPQAFIQFQRQDDPDSDRFTVNLLCAPATVSGRVRFERAARLGYVLWYVYGVRDYAVSDYWWTAPSETQLQAALADAVEKILQYGLPWVEDAAAPKPWEMPVSRAAEFGAAVHTMLTPTLERVGYRSGFQALGGELPYCYFSKTLADGTFALIEVQPIYSLDPEEFYFDVRLQRRDDDDPLGFDGNYGHWRSMSLAQLAWQQRGAPQLDRLAVSDAKGLFWRYRNQAELHAQLRDVLDQLTRIGCAWVEQGTAGMMIQ